MARILSWPARARWIGGAICAIGVLAPGAATATSSSPARKPKPSSCSATRQNQSVTIRFRFHDHLYHVYGGQPEGLPPQTVNVRPPHNHRFGTVTIGAATCHSPKGWRVISPMNVNSSSRGIFVDANKKLELTGKGPGEGWGIAIDSVHHGSMYVRAVACRQGHLWKDINEIRSFPIPGGYVVSLLQWAANAFIPLPQDKVRCGNLGVDRLHIFASHTGTLRVTSPSSGRGMNGIFEQSNQSAGGKDISLDHTRAILKPKIS
jgi:hypothetical protein